MSDTFISLNPKRDVALFDLDGTVLDTYAPILESMRYATKTVFGEALPDSKLVSMVGQPLVTQMQAFAAERGCGSEIADELTRVYREYNERDLDEKSFPFPGIPEAIASLKNAGFTVGVVTSKRAVLATKSLKAHGLFDAFACVNGAEDSTAHKPDPDPLLTAAKKLGVSPDRCVYVGDSPYDLQAAHAASMPCVGVTWGKFFGRDILLEQMPSVLIASPEELVGAVEFAAIH
ncbi:MAG: HAD-IA family hydrolase [Eggerthellaceae bacterium]|nr:HAD-IA family hydrolase [Eggerthellaceae bacterium]